MSSSQHSNRTNILKIVQNDIANASSVVTLTENGWDNFIRIMEEPFVHNEKLQSAFNKLQEVEVISEKS